MNDNLLPNESVAKLEKMFEEFDHNMKIVDFHLETESFYDLENTGKNIKHITIVLADSSRILANIHAIRFEFTTEYQLKIYDRIKKRFDLFEAKRDKVHTMQEKLIQKINFQQDLLTRASYINKNNNEAKVLNDKYNLQILQRSEVIDVNLKTDFNENLLNEVGANLREIDQNVRETAINLKGQGDAFKNMTQSIDGTDNNIKRANKTLSSLTWGHRIQLILLHLIAILLFIGVIVLLILKLINSSS